MQEMGRPPPDDSSEDEEYDTTPLLMADVRRNTQVRGPKIQRYSADGLQLVKTYSGHVDAVRDAELPDMCRLRIKNATNTATLYKGFRWAALERAMPDDTVQDIGPTVVSATIQKGLVAMLDLDKKCVVQVFMDQKDAAEKRHFTGCAAISNAIKRGSKSSGHYFVMWHDCPEALKAEYLSRDTLPEKRSHGKGVDQLHPITGALVKHYSSIEEAIIAMRMARKCLMSAVEFQAVAKGYKWRFSLC